MRPLVCSRSAGAGRPGEQGSRHHRRIGAQPRSRRRVRDPRHHRRQLRPPHGCQRTRIAAPRRGVREADRRVREVRSSPSPATMPEICPIEHRKARSIESSSPRRGNSDRRGSLRTSSILGRSIRVGWTTRREPGWRPAGHSAVWALLATLPESLHFCSLVRAGGSADSCCRQTEGSPLATEASPRQSASAPSNRLLGRSTAFWTSDRHRSTQQSPSAEFAGGSRRPGAQRLCQRSPN